MITSLISARARWIAVAVPAIAIGVVLLSAPSRAPATSTDHDHHGAPMTDADMKTWIDSWYATHPEVRPEANGVIADVFTVHNFRFDTDGVVGTQVDTAHIFVGESIQWNLVDGFHTVTSDITAEDPDGGDLFDAGLDPGSSQFVYTFNEAGTFGFFCRPHEFLTMRGVVVVSVVVGVDGPSARSVGFASSPAPNPTGAGVSFRFTTGAGRVRAEIFDARGRRVAMLADGGFDAGTHTLSWNGRTASGRVAPVGVYHVRLALPGKTDSRQIVVSR